MNRLYIVEGIPGSGKTTYAKALAEKLRASGQETALYTEGDLHPADMAWCALLTRPEYESALAEYPGIRAHIEENASDWEDRKIVAYTKIPDIDPKAYAFFESREVYDGRVPKETFCRVHESRWRAFGESARGVTVFECALLQNHGNELRLFHNADESEICAQIARLLRCVDALRPVVIYLNVDTRKALERAARSRTDENGERVWESRVAEYISNSPYGRKTGLTGTEGMTRYFEERRQMELRILDALPIEKELISVQID